MLPCLNGRDKEPTVRQPQNNGLLEGQKVSLMVVMQRCLERSYSFTCQSFHEALHPKLGESTMLRTGESSLGQGGDWCFSGTLVLKRALDQKILVLEDRDRGEEICS